LRKSDPSPDNTSPENPFSENPSSQNPSNSHSSLFDPSDTNAIPHTNEDLADLIMYRLNNRHSAFKVSSSTLPCLLNKDLDQDKIAKQKLNQFIKDNPQLTKKGRLGQSVTLSCFNISSERTNIIKALRGG
jgi:hypothetical protein